MTRTVYFLTGARSEYDLLTPVIRLVSNTDGLSAGIIASAAHLSPFHGNGINQIRSDGFPVVATIESLLSSDTWRGRSLSFATLTNGLTGFLSASRPDILFIAGDREEALAGAIVANFLGIHVAHLHGGDRCVASDIDEVLRPAISKLAHLHFVATEGHRQRLVRMGEDPERIWISGATGLDRFRVEPEYPEDQLSSELGFDVRQPFFLVIQHPSPMFGNSDPKYDPKWEMHEVLSGVLSLNHTTLCSYPNTDPGNFPMRQAIDEMKEKHDKLITYHNLDRNKFVALYRRCSAIIGNSSSILIESPFLKVPGVLVGPRQDLREASSNVVRVNINSAEISSACQKALEDAEFKEQVRSCRSIYGDGDAAPRIVGVLSSIELTAEMLRKTITY